MVSEEAYDCIGEIFIERIEPATDRTEHPVPDGYGENGIWICGGHDNPWVAGAMDSGRSPSVIACIGEAGWVQRRMELEDAVEQVETVTARTSECCQKKRRGAYGAPAPKTNASATSAGSERTASAAHHRSGCGAGTRS